MMMLSDQQLVTGLAILVAGYYEMLHNDMPIYYWQIVVYLAFISSSVHIASLTLLRDVLNKNPTLRNFRVAGMLVLFILLMTAMWPMRHLQHLDIPAMPAKCLWTSTVSNTDIYTTRNHPAGRLSIEVDANWLLSSIMLVLAYVWKLSQLFASSSGLVRRWLVAKPEAAMERLLRRVTLSRRSVWITWPVRNLVTISYISYVAYAELAESFLASILYLFLALPYGITSIMRTRFQLDGHFPDGGKSVTFGQLVPLFMLLLPFLSVFEVSSGE